MIPLNKRSASIKKYPVNILRLPAQMESLERFRSFILQKLELMGLRREIVLQIELVLEELLSNIIKYTYPHGTGEVEVGCSLERNKLCLSIRDWGTPFNPFEYETLDPTLDIMDRKIGGLGIYLVKNIVDEYNYQRQGESNFLRVYFTVKPTINNH